MRDTSGFDILTSSDPLSLNDALEIAKIGQIERDFSPQITKIAGRLDQQILQIFPGHLQIIFVLTSSVRRHVWFLYLASTKVDDPVAVRHDLLTKSNKELVTEIYGNLPSGFLRILGQISPLYKDQGVYEKLHQLLAQSSGLARKLSAYELDEEMIDLLIHLPDQFKNMKVARAFGGLRNYDHFKDLCEVLRPEKPNLLHDSLSKIKSSASLERVIWGIYNSIDFPSAVLPAHPDLDYIKNGRQLRKIAKEWKNCLDMFVEEALQNQLQFYIMTLSSGEEIVFSLKNDFPFGWYLGDSKDQNDDSLSMIQQIEVQELLDDLGFGQTESVNDRVKSLVLDCEQAQKWRRRRVLRS